MKNLLLLFFLFLCFTACDSSAPDAEKETVPAAVQVNNPVSSADSITLADIPVYGDFADLEYIFRQQSDTTYIINFWATWCKPCVAELPYFEDLHDNFVGEKMRVILVSIDFPKQLESKLVPFINEHRLRSEVIVLTDGRYNDWIDKVSPEWGGNIPVTYIYNAERKEFIAEAFEDTEDLRERVRKFF